MPDAGKNAITTITYSLAGDPPVYIDFTFLDKDHVKVEVSTDSGASYTAKTRNTHYTIDSLNFINWTTGNAPPAASTTRVRMTRDTPHPSDGGSYLAAEFTSRAPLNQTDLENCLKQCLYYAEEVADA
tara:strand:- start:1445 stop:1828 length:384 start_codon:yes stop_codon:yes gene_type:complete